MNNDETILTQRHDVEFKIGDPVTYYPYRQKYRATVSGIRAHKTDFGRDDHRVFYILTGRDGNEVTAIASGARIHESKYFDRYCPIHAKDFPWRESMGKKPACTCGHEG